MPGMDRNTGRWISGRAHIAQSVDIILGTPIGTRVERRQFGADDKYLIDRPQAESEVSHATMAVAVALDAWEPRFALKSVIIKEGSVEGRLTLAMGFAEYPRGHFGDKTPADAAGNLKATL